MRNSNRFGLILLIVAGLTSPAIAQDGGGEAHGVRYRSLMPLQVDINKFTLVGSGDFSVGEDQTKSIQGWAGHNFDTVALMPLDNMAACNDLKVSYSSGEAEDYPLLRPGLLSHKQIYQVVLRGEPSEVESIEASCHALGDGSVTIGFYGAAGELF